jgi:ABC-type metal ion transport system substrate-binding protein
VLIPVRRTYIRHELLDLEFIEEEEGTMVVVGVTTIRPMSLYMVRVKDIGIIWVD